jgi:hypothetical protein
MVRRPTPAPLTGGHSSLRAISRGLLCAIALALALHTSVHGQLAAPNTPVLPPLPVDPADPNAILKTDLVMQRQVEPEIVASTRNSQHLIAFFNDYRSVVIANDNGIGGSKFARVGGAINRFIARLLGHPLEPVRSPYIAAAEATTGVAQSSDGGLTWTGGLAPGSFDDTSPAGMASAAHGLEAMTDPRGVAAPCGVAYLINVAFTRSGASKLLWTKYQDQNLVDGGLTWAFQGQGVIETGNNAPGHFHDLPYAVVDVPRPATGNPCDHVLYVAWARFSGSASASKIMFAKSSNGAQTWTTKYVKSTNKTDQGLVMTVDKRPGVPAQGGGGTLFLGWRVFGPSDPNAMFITSSRDFGNSFAAARPITGGTPLYAYDQPSLGTNVVGAAHLAFRSNAFMTLESVPHPTDPNRSTLFAAWQERVNLLACGGAQPGPDCGLPSPTGDPRIVVTRSADNGVTWVDSLGLPGRRAVDIGDRDNPNSPDRPRPGFGYLPIFRASGQQLMPRFSYGAGRLALGYLEARGPLNSLPPSAGIAGGMSRQTDARLALLDPVTGALVGTNQISRYPVKVGANLADGETPDDIVEHTPGVKAISDRSNAPNSGGGITPFFGDFLGLNPITTFVRDRVTGQWRHAIRSGDSPFRGFHMVFPDSRNVVPPEAPTPDQQALLYQLYDPPGLNRPSCINPGARNHDVMHALVDAGVPVNTIAGYKKLGVIARNFPITFHNVQGATRFFRASFPPEDRAEGSFDQFDPAVDTIDLEILPYSSITHSVTVESADPLASVTVNVVELSLSCTVGPVALDNPACTSAISPNGESGSVTLNLDPTNGANAAATDTETHNPIVTNPIVTNPIVTNPIVTNTTASNPIVTNPIVTNPIVTNDALADKTVYGITDVTWTVTNAGTDATGYATRVALENFRALSGNYVFHLFIYKVAAAAKADGCTTTAIPQDQILSSIPNPIVTNPIVTNPIVTNPIVTNPIVTNSTFAASPAESGTPNAAAARSAGTVAAAAAPTFAPDGTMQDVRDDAVRVTLRGYQIVPTEQLTPDTTFNPLDTAPAIAVTSTVTNTINGVVEETPPSAGNGAADLLIEGYTPTPGLTASVGGEVTLSSFTMRNQGTGNANAAGGEFRSGAYLSVDPVISPDRDLFLGGFDTDNEDLPAGGSTSRDGPNVTIPGVVPGNYFIGIYINDQFSVVEAPLTNNSVSEPIVITGGTAFTGLRFVTQPAPASSNQPIGPSVQVEARDTFGAVLPGVGITLSFGATPGGPATLTGTTATTNAIGVATFPNVRIDVGAAGYTLVANAQGLNRTSEPFNIYGVASPTCSPTVPFGVSAVLPMGANPVALVARDLNGGGGQDLVTVNQGDNTIAVRFAPAFGGAPLTFTTGTETQPADIVAGDFNRDGFVDIATVNPFNTNVSVLLGTSTGSFGAPAFFDVSDFGQKSIATGDIDGDGRLDLVVTAVEDDVSFAGVVNVLRGSGAGGFSPATEHAIGINPQDLVVADFDGDGLADVAVVHPGDATSPTDGYLTVRRAGGASGNFFAPVTFTLTAPPHGAAAGDINGDGDLDLAAVHDNGIDVLHGNGAGSFTLVTTLPLLGTGRHIVVGDFSGDGLADMAATTSAGLAVLINEGSGGFNADTFLFVGGNPQGLVAGDWDSDGRTDLAVANGSPDDGVAIVTNQCGEAAFVVTNTADNGPGSLRQAILTANATPGVQTITFNITGPPGTVHTIVLGSTLDPITDGVLIDGTTQPGFVSSPLVVVDGIKAGSGPGILVQSNATIKGLSIVRFLTGISVPPGGDGTVIQGCYIGVTPDGVAAGNGLGIQVSGAAKVQIGGGALRNVISANTGAGISAAGGIDFPIQILGNRIGTDPDGVADLGNGTAGVFLSVPATVDNNVISGNSGDGIQVLQDDNRLLARGNFIGTNAAGTAAIPNTGAGISISDAEFSVIGGTNAAERNVISGNGSAGISIQFDASGTTIQGNYVGTDAAGTGAIPNLGGIAVVSTPGVGIGGTAAGAGNLISGNTGHGVVIQDSNNVIVEGNFIGVNAAGTADLGNTASGVLIAGESIGNTIGGTAAGARNVISGNDNNGVWINSVLASDNTIANNFIGTNATATAGIGNGTLNEFLDLVGAGVLVAAGTANKIGLAVAGGRNFISGNGTGVSVTGGTQTSIAGNAIGTDGTGNGSIRNRWGIFLSGGSETSVGGTTALARNLVSGNLLHGIQVSGTANTLIAGNYIGTTAAGNVALANQFSGIFVFQNPGAVTIGGEAAGAGNLIGGNGHNGITIQESSNAFIFGNIIGGVPGDPVPNAQSGVSITESFGSVIGGPAPGQANTIRFNGGNGITVGGLATGQEIKENSIDGNTGIGIDLGGDGVTANDGPGDVDEGSNSLQNFPAIASAIRTTGTAVSGNITTTTAVTVVLRFFVSSSCDPSGNGEGETFLGSVNVVTNVDGLGVFNVSFSGGAVGQFVTATATDPNGNTSEFSACRVITAG